MSVTSQNTEMRKSHQDSHSARLSDENVIRTPGQQFFILFACVFCSLILAVDVLGEALAAITHPTSLLDWGHILIELFATGLLGIAAYMAWTQMTAFKATAARSAEKLQHLRFDFDVVLKQRFAQWNLSKSEIDVALLTVRGLSICRIAELRHTQQGTIKAQLSAIFRKAGVASRTELLAMFIDELLDFGSERQEKRPPSQAAF